MNDTKLIDAVNPASAQISSPSHRLQPSSAARAAAECVHDAEHTFRFHYFAMRKMHVAMRASALVIFPGGFGTMDELFELLTLRQTNKSPQIPIVLFDPGCWNKLLNFEMLLEEGMISRQDLELFEFASSAEETWEILVRRGLRSHSKPDACALCAIRAGLTAARIPVLMSG